MRKLVPVSKASKLENGTMIEVVVEGREILLAKVGDRYYATDNRCPHMGAKLSQGKLEGTVVTCPRHGSRFDISDGHNMLWLNTSGLLLALAKLIKRPRPVSTYQVKIDGDDILVNIEP